MIYSSTYFAERDSDAVALIDPQGEAWSRGQLETQANRLARALTAAGLSPGEVIAIVAPNCAEYLAVYLAGIRAGFYVVPVNCHLAPPELAYVLADCGARAVFAHAALGEAQLLEIARQRKQDSLRICIGAAPGYLTLHDFMAAHSGARFTCAATGRVMPYTSATTGRPKAVRLPLANGPQAMARIVAWHRSLGIEPEAGNVHLCSSMLYHSAPLEGVVTALHMGHRVVLMGQWQAGECLARIARYGVTTAFLVPTMFMRLLKLPAAERARQSTSSLRFVVHGGAPCPVEIKRRMLEWWGPIIWEAYGAAEGQGCIVSAQEWLEQPGTVGRPIPGSAVKVLDESKRECAPMQVGQVYLRPHTGDLFQYEGDPLKTSAAIHGRFITVGDLGYLNAAGYLFLCDRRADLILSSGMNIYPAEIEMVLVQHPLVKDCAVVGVDHPMLGEVAKAYIELEPDVCHEPALTAQILQYLGARLSAMKLPQQIEYIAAVPRDPNGKLYRRLLRREGKNSSDRRD